MMSPGVLLILGSSATPLPPELRDLAERAGMQSLYASTLFEVAAKVAEAQEVRVLLIEPTALTTKIAASLAVFRRQSGIPIIILPSPEPLAAGLAEQLPPGVLLWGDTLPPLARIIQIPIRDDPSDGNVVTSPLQPRYDEFDAPPLLSEQEMRALLGPLE